MQYRLYLACLIFLAMPKVLFAERPNILVIMVAIWMKMATDELHVPEDFRGLPKR
jgi:hypothetical protein